MNKKKQKNFYELGRAHLREQRLRPTGGCQRHSVTGAYDGEDMRANDALILTIFELVPRLFYLAKRLCRAS